MADLPGEAYIHRYNELVKKLTGAKGGEPMHELAAELLPALILENDPPEYAIYKGELLWSIPLNQGASVGNFSHIGVRNPGSSGIISRVEFFNLDTAGVIEILVSAHAPVQAGATLNAAVQRDFRAKGVPTSTGVAFTNAAQIGAVIGRMELPVGMVPTPLPVVLGENNELLFFPGTANNALAGWVMGRERSFEPSEKPA